MYLWSRSDSSSGSNGSGLCAKTTLAHQATIWKIIHLWTESCNFISLCPRDVLPSDSTTFYSCSNVLVTDITENRKTWHIERPGTTLAKKIETAENHDVERKLFDVLGHVRRSKKVFRSCALGSDRWWPSAVSHDRTPSYQRHKSRLSQVFLARIVERMQWEHYKTSRYCCVQQSLQHAHQSADSLAGQRMNNFYHCNTIYRLDVSKPRTPAPDTQQR